MSSLILNTYIIQHMIRNNVISMDRDRVNITLLVYVMTYFVMFGTHSNPINLLICYIESLTIVKNPNFHRKHNLDLGHFISYILEVKYSIFFFIKFDHIHSHFTDHSFHILYDGRRHFAQIARQVEEEEEHSKGEPQEELHAPQH